MQLIKITETGVFKNIHYHLYFLFIFYFILLVFNKFQYCNFIAVALCYRALPGAELTSLLIPYQQKKISKIYI